MLRRHWSADLIERFQAAGIEDVEVEPRRGFAAFRGTRTAADRSRPGPRRLRAGLFAAAGRSPPLDLAARPRAGRSCGTGSRSARRVSSKSLSAWPEPCVIENPHPPCSSQVAFTARIARSPRSKLMNSTPEDVDQDVDVRRGRGAEKAAIGTRSPPQVEFAPRSRARARSDSCVQRGS